MTAATVARVLDGTRLMPVLTVPDPGTADALTAGGARCAEIDASRMATCLADPAVLAVGGSWMATTGHLERGAYAEVRRLTAQAVRGSAS